MLTFQNLYDWQVLVGHFKQKKILELNASLPWDYEKAKAKLAFQGGQEFHAEVLGIEHKEDKRWIWASSVKESGIPEVSLNSVERIQRVGHINDIPQLVDNHVSLNEVSALDLALIGTGYTDAVGYFALESPGVGFAWILLFDEAKKPISFSALEVSTFVTEALQSFEISDHRFSINTLLEFLSGEEVDEEDEMTLTDSSGHAITFQFDNAKRLSKINVTAGC